MTTLTLDLPPADEAAFRELASAPAEVRAAALQKAIGVVRRGAANDTATSAANGNGTTPETTRPLTAREILAAPPDVREAALKASAEAAAEFYASPEGRAEWEELADWRALDGEDFYGFEDEDAEVVSLQEEHKVS